MNLYTNGRIKAKARFSGIDRGFDSHPIIDGYSFKAMPGSIVAPNPG